MSAPVQRAWLAFYGLLQEHPGIFLLFLQATRKPRPCPRSSHAYHAAVAATPKLRAARERWLAEIKADFDREMAA